MLAANGDPQGQGFTRRIRGGFQPAGPELEAEDTVGAPEEAAHALRDCGEARLIQLRSRKTAPRHMELRCGTADPVEQDAELGVGRAGIRWQAELQR